MTDYETLPNLVPAIEEGYMSKLVNLNRYGLSRSLKLVDVSNTD